MITRSIFENKSSEYLEAIDTAHNSAIRLVLITSILKERERIIKNDDVLDNDLINLVIEQLELQEQALSNLN